MLGVILVVLAILFFIVFVLTGWVIGIYNWYQSIKQDLNTQWSNIKTEYQRRADLFYNLAESVKSHKKFEKSTLIEVVAARAKGLTGSIPNQKKQIKGMEAAFAKLLAVFEQYPNLKSHTHYEKFMEEVRITEDRINVARTSLNDIVREYNVGVKVFPRNIVAKWFGFRVEAYFKADDYAQDPKSYRVSLD